MQAPASSGGGMLSGIGSTIAQGMAFGTGSAIAHRAVGAVAGAMGGGGGSNDPQVDMANQQQMQPMQMQQQPQLSGACGQDKQMFFECLQMNRGDQQSCAFLYDQLQMCQRNETQFGA
jgi:coiled-coil-helix-coiled-coil-helix domain-containing protein 10